MTTDEERLSPRITPVLLADLAKHSAVQGGSSSEVLNPATGDLIAHVPRGTPADVVAAAERAQTAQPGWAGRSVDERVAVIMRFRDLLLSRYRDVLDLIQLENGKARAHAFEEVLDVAMVVRYYSRVAPRLLRTRRHPGAVPVLSTGYEVAHPKGVVGIMSPWNYPLALGISDAVPALLAGNAVLAKPDESTPFSALWAAALLAEAGLPAGVLQVVTGSGAELGEAVVGAVDAVMFTGSTKVGRQVAAQAASRLIDVSLELGGKNAMLVLDDADLSRPVPGAVRAAFSSSGQLCIAAERILVDARVWDEFVPGFVAATGRVRLGHGFDHSFDMGTLRSQRQLDVVRAHLDDAVAKGATVLAGGRARPDLGPYFHEPTILTNVTESMTVHSEETFGPVVSLYRVDSVDEAVDLANDTSYGLSFSVWGADTTRARRVAERLRTGNVNINESHAATWGATSVPMGGWKDSGLGARHGEHGLMKFCDVQNIAVQRGIALTKPAHLPHAAYERLMKVLVRVPRNY